MLRYARTPFQGISVLCTTIHYQFVDGQILQYLLHCIFCLCDDFSLHAKHVEEMCLQW
jgi:hypothetical protein